MLDRSTLIGKADGDGGHVDSLLEGRAVVREYESLAVGSWNPQGPGVGRKFTGEKSLGENGIPGGLAYSGGLMRVKLNGSVRLIFVLPLWSSEQGIDNVGSEAAKVKEQLHSWSAIVR